MSEDRIHMRAMKSGETTHPDQYASFWCVACDSPHMLGVGDVQKGPRWGWNGDKVKPVFTPSVLSRHDRMSAAGRERNAAFYKEHGRYMTREELPYDEHHCCHSFVGCNGAQPGQIVYLGDCTHAMAGQVVDLPPYPENWK